MLAIGSYAGGYDNIVVSCRPVLIFDLFQRGLPDRTRMFDCQASSLVLGVNQSPSFGPNRDAG